LNRLISGTPLTFQSFLHSIYVSLYNSKFISITGDVNRVQKVHLSEIFFRTNTWKVYSDDNVLVFSPLYHLFTARGNKLRWLLANGCVLFYKAYRSDACCSRNCEFWICPLVFTKYLAATCSI